MSAVIDPADVRVHFVPGHGNQRFPHLLDAPGAELGIAIEGTTSPITLSDRRAAQLQPRTTRYAGSSAGGQ